MADWADLERIERQAWTELYRAGPGQLALEALDVAGGTVLVCAAADHPFLNRAIGVPVDRLDEAVAVFRARGVARWFLHVHDDDLNRAVAWGRTHSIVPYRRAWAKFVRHGGRLPRLSTELTVADALPEHAEAVGRLFSDGFDLPARAAPLFAAMVGRTGWAVSVALDGDRVVGAGSLFVDGDGGYLAGGTTARSYRRRGVQGALMARRLVQARARGARWVSTETGEAVEGEPNSSWRNMERCGFRAVGRRPNLAPEGTTWGQGS